MNLAGEKKFALAEVSNLLLFLQAASTSPLFSATLKLSCFALPAPPFCANPLVVVLASLRVSPSSYYLLVQQ
jgi:hypothetical protein